MKKLFFLVIVFAFTATVHAQSNVLPAPPQKGDMYIKNAIIHVGNGTVIENGTIVDMIPMDPVNAAGYGRAFRRAGPVAGWSRRCYG